MTTPKSPSEIAEHIGLIFSPKWREYPNLIRNIKDAITTERSRVEQSEKRISEQVSEIAGLVRKNEELEKELKVCTGCGRLNIPVKPPALACCPDDRYRTASQLLEELDECKADRQELLEGIKMAVEAMKSVESDAKKGDGWVEVDSLNKISRALTTLNSLVARMK